MKLTSPREKAKLQLGYLDQHPAYVKETHTYIPSGAFETSNLRKCNKP